MGFHIFKQHAYWVLLRQSAMSCQYHKSSQLYNYVLCNCLSDTCSKYSTQ